MIFQDLCHVQKAAPAEPRYPEIGLRKFIIFGIAFTILHHQTSKNLIFNAKTLLENCFVANKPLHECQKYICVELDFRPEGRPRTNDKGECCAPFSSRNMSKHT